MGHSSFYVDASAGALFTLFYVLFCTGFILQFREFVGAGLSPENILASGVIRCAEEVQFIEFHLRKTAGTVVLHSLLPLGYLLGYSFFRTNLDHAYPSILDFWEQNYLLQNVLVLAILAPIISAIMVKSWAIDNWSKHPFVEILMPYAREGLWRQVAGDINTEYRRIDKFTIQASPVTKVVVTDNWIVLVGQWPWSFQLAHQSDVTLELTHSQHHDISTDGQAGGTQYLKIEVKNRRQRTRNFSFRLNALEYQNLCDKLREPIANISNVQIYKTVSERFVEVFKEEVGKNPMGESHEVEDDLDNCIGCMVNRANVRLVRRCNSESEGSNSCVNCYCRPMWCIDCLGKWFASRQNQQEPETWLSSKCPCPTCRSKFCILDVARIPFD